MFSEMLTLIRDGILDMVFKLYPTQQQGGKPAAERLKPSKPASNSRVVAMKQDYHSTITAMPESATVGGGQNQMPPPPQSIQPTRPIRVAPKVGRNDLCPCGSGKKYKNCHGAEV